MKNLLIYSSETTGIAATLNVFMSRFKDLENTQFVQVSVPSDLEKYVRASVGPETECIILLDLCPSLKELYDLCDNEHKVVVIARKPSIRKFFIEVQIDHPNLWVFVDSADALSTTLEELGDELNQLDQLERINLLDGLSQPAFGRVILSNMNLRNKGI